MFRSFVSTQQQAPADYGRPRSRTCYPQEPPAASQAAPQELGVRDRVSRFNQTLVTDEIHYTLKDYMYSFQAHFFPGDEYMHMYALGCRSSQGDFCMREEEMPSGMDTSRKILDKCGLLDGVDYIYCNRYGEGWFKRFTKVKIFTSMAFKKILLLNGDPRFVNYYVFVDQAIEAYNAYQLQYARLEKRKADARATRLQEQLLAKELEIVRLKRISELHLSKPSGATSKDWRCPRDADDDPCSSQDSGDSIYPATTPDDSPDASADDNELSQSRLIPRPNMLADTCGPHGEITVTDWNMDMISNCSSPRRKQYGGYDSGREWQ